MADDLDFEAVERLLDNAEGVALGGEKERRKSRSRRRDRRKEEGRRDDRERDRDRDRDRSERRDKPERDARPNRDERRPKEPAEDPAERERRKAEEYAKQEQERMERRKREEEEERQRLADEATRGDRTVFVTNVSSRAGEREVYEFFSKFAGKVRDVQIIRDQRSHKSKGVCYVEFYLQETVMKALSLSGQVLDNNPIRVVPSQADKNRAAQVLAKAFQPPPGPEAAGMKLYIGGLTETLANITEDELRKLFSPFGNIQFIDMHRDPYTNKCKGYAFVMFDKAVEAKEAMTAMNNFELAGQRLKVGLATENQIPGSSPMPMAIGNAPTELGGLTESLTDEGPGNHPGLLKDASARMALMQKLQRDGAMPTGMPLPGMNSMSGNGAPHGMPMGGMGEALNVCLKNMFDPNSANLVAEPNFFRDIEEDVYQECNSHGQVQKVVVDRNSRDGCVYVRFGNSGSAMACQRALDRRWFAGAQIQATFIDDRTFGQTADL